MESEDASNMTIMLLFNFDHAVDLVVLGSCFGTVMTTVIAPITASAALKSSPIAAAYRMVTLSVRPRNSSASGVDCESSVLSALKIAAEIATPKAAPNDEAIL